MRTLALLALLSAAAAAAAARVPLQAANSAANGKRPAPEEKCYPIAWNILARSGESIGSGVFGELKGSDGRTAARVVAAESAMPALDRSKATFADAALAKSFTAPKGFKLAAQVSLAPDIPTVHSVGGKQYVINHFEYPQPSTVYISELSAPDSKGAIKLLDTKPVPDSAFGGFWFMCTGSKTPWGTHLAGEEYPPDCRSYEDLFLPCKLGPEAAANACNLPGDDGPYLIEFGRYYGFYGNGTSKGLGAVDFFTNKDAHKAFTSKFSCYNYGSSPEIRVSPGGGTSVTKWRTMGRISHELAYVMPDNRTVYTTDDHPNGVFLKFKADKPGDFSSGALYAAKFSDQKTNDKGNPTWAVSWVELGRGDQKALDKMAADPSFRFSSIFETATPTGSPPTCPAGFSLTNTPNARYTVKLADGTEVFAECLKVKDGMRTAAAFLEPRRLASMLGATTQFEKQEGFTFSPATGRAYFTVSRITKGMINDTRHTATISKGIQLKENRCGGIMAMDLDSEFTGTKAELILVGDNKPTADKANKCNVEGIAEPDNLIVVGDQLMIQEDASGHVNNVMWAFDLNTGKLTRVLSAVQGAEVSGAWLNQIGGSGYMTVAIQHPFEKESDAAEGNITQEQLDRFRGYIGYIGPLPKAALAPNALVRFEGIPVASGAAMNDTVGTTKVCVSTKA